MKRCKLYVAIMLVFCILASSGVAVLASEVVSITLPMSGVSCEVYETTPYGFVVRDRDYSGEGKLRTYLVNDKGIVFKSDFGTFDTVSDCGYIALQGENSAKVVDLKGNTIIPEGKYGTIDILNNNRFVCTVKYDTGYGYDEFKTGLVDKKGKEIIPFGKYDSFYINGMIMAYDYETYDYELLDLNGNVLVPFESNEEIILLGVSDRYIAYNPDENISYLYNEKGKLITKFNGYASFHPYNSIDLVVYDDSGEAFKIDNYDVDGNLLSSYLCQDHAERPYTSYDVTKSQLELYIENSDTICDKNGKKTYESDKYYLYEVIGNKYVVAYNEDWEMGIIDAKGNVVCDFGKYTKAIYCNDLDLYAFFNVDELVIGRLGNSSNNEIKVRVNGEKIVFDQQPVIEGGRTLVPLRAIFEALGADVKWNADTQTVTATKNGIEVSLRIGSENLYVNGEKKKLDIPAKIVGGRTLVPVRAISEAFGCSVDWNADTRTVIINE